MSSLNVSTSLDEPEGGFDALMQVAACRVSRNKAIGSIEGLLTVLTISKGTQVLFN